MGKAMLIIPIVIYVILLGLMFYFKPPYVAATTNGVRALVWKRALIADLILTIGAVVLLFMFAPEVMLM